MSEQTINLTQTQLTKMIADAVASVTAKQVSVKNNQVSALPVGAHKAECWHYTEYFPVYHLINDANPSLGYVLQQGGKFNGRPKAFGFRKQNRKEIVITWANGAQVRFMKTQDSPNVHDSRTPTMNYTQDHVVAELKRVMGDDNKALKGAAWLMNVVTYDKSDDATKYGKMKDASRITYGKLFGKKAKQPRTTATAVAPSVPLAAATDSAEIPF